MPTKVVVKLELSDEIIRKYEEQTTSDKAVEDVLEKRLADCVDHNAQRGLYFNDAQRGELEKILGGNFLTSAAEAISRGKQLATVKVNGVDIQIDQAVLKRAEGRAGAMRLSVDEWLKNEIATALEFSVGLRG